MVKKEKRKIKNEGNRFDKKEQQALVEEDIDEGFEIVRDKNQHRRQQRVIARTEDKDGEQKRNDDGFKMKRGGAFGNLGGGGDDSD